MAMRYCLGKLFVVLQGYWTHTRLIPRFFLRPKEIFSTRICRSTTKVGFSSAGLPALENKLGHVQMRVASGHWGCVERRPIASASWDSTVQLYFGSHLPLSPHV